MKKIILSIAVLALALSSCEDFLTKEPPMDQSDELALSTFEGIDGATAGNYRAVISWYGASFPLTFDVMCGNGMVGPVNTGRMRMEPAWNYTSTSTMGLWSSAYSAILGCNKALTAINEGKFSRDGVSDEQINNIKAENLFLRALAYFDLVRVYAQPYGYIKANGITGVEAMGVPIVLKDDLSARPSRNTVAEVYENLIIPDLVEAERLMSDSYVRRGERCRGHGDETGYPSLDGTGVSAPRRLAVGRRLCDESDQERAFPSAFGRPLRIDVGRLGRRSPPIGQRNHI